MGTAEFLVLMRPVWLLIHVGLDQCSEVSTLRWARLVPGWVTVFGRVNHLDAKPGTQVYSTWAIPPWICEMSTQRKVRSKQANRVIH